MITVYRKAIDVVRRLGDVANGIQARDSDLARQLRRAATSVPLNIAEGEHGMGRRKQASFSVALGSARETRACMHVAVALGYVEGVDEVLEDELDHIIAMLYRLAR